MDIPHDARIAVLDGRKFLLLRNSGDEAFPVLDVEEEHHASDATHYDADADSPARSPADTADEDEQNARGGDGHAGGPGGPGTHAGRAQPDDRKRGEVDFAAAMAERLNKLAEAHAFPALFVVAAPKTLGELRKRYSKRLEAAIKGELAKELTNRPAQDIADALKGHHTNAVGA